VSEAAFTDDGVVIDSGEYSGLDSETARERLTADIESAETTTQYRLRDWGSPDSATGGTPIPVVHCDDCGSVLVPGRTCRSNCRSSSTRPGTPRRRRGGWKETTCPECGEPATRETDTMDTFVDSSWYFLRYVSPGAEDVPFDLDRANDWMPVDQYVGGIEHAVMHLLYSRFVTKVLADEEGGWHTASRSRTCWRAGDGPAGGREDVQVEGEHGLSPAHRRRVRCRHGPAVHHAGGPARARLRLGRGGRQVDAPVPGAPDGLGRGVRGGEARQPRARTPTATRSTITSPTRSTPPSPSRARSTTT